MKRYRTPPRQFGEQGYERRWEQRGRNWREDRSPSNSREDRRQTDNFYRSQRRRYSHSPDKTGHRYNERNRDRINLVNERSKHNDEKLEERDRRSVSPCDNRGDFDSYHSRWKPDKGIENKKYSSASERRTKEDGDHSSRERIRKYSHSPQGYRHSSRWSRHQRSHSRSPVDKTRLSVKGSQSLSSGLKSSQREQLSSKWARHRDSAESSSDEDVDQEKTLWEQNKSKEAENVFGLEGHPV